MRGQAQRQKCHTHTHSLTLASSFVQKISPPKKRFTEFSLSSLIVYCTPYPGAWFCGQWPADFEWVAPKVWNFQSDCQAWLQISPQYKSLYSPETSKPYECLLSQAILLKTNIQLIRIFSYIFNSTWANYFWSTLFSMGWEISGGAQFLVLLPRLFP